MYVTLFEVTLFHHILRGGSSLNKHIKLWVILTWNLCPPHQKSCCPIFQDKDRELLDNVDPLANVYLDNPIVAHSSWDICNQ